MHHSVKQELCIKKKKKKKVISKCSCLYNIETITGWLLKSLLTRHSCIRILCILLMKSVVQSKNGWFEDNFLIQHLWFSRPPRPEVIQARLTTSKVWTQSCASELFSWPQYHIIMILCPQWFSNQKDQAYVQVLCSQMHKLTEDTLFSLVKLWKSNIINNYLGVSWNPWIFF